MPLVRSNEVLPSMVIESFLPSNFSARPKNAVVTRLAPEILPWFANPDASITSLPAGSSKPYAATGPFAADVVVPLVVVVVPPVVVPPVVVPPVVVPPVVVPPVVVPPVVVPPVVVPPVVVPPVTGAAVALIDLVAEALPPLPITVSVTE